MQRIRLRFGQSDMSDGKIGRNICGRLLMVIRARYLMNNAMVLPLILHTLPIPESSRDPDMPTTYERICDILRLEPTLSPNFLASFVPKLPVESSSVLSVHIPCFTRHTTNLPVVYDATRTTSGKCIYCNLVSPV